MSIYDILTGILLAIGSALILIGAIGILRMPDFYTRMHPAGKADTLAQSLIMIALMFQAGLSLVSVKLFLIMVFLLFTTPTSTHAVARTAYLSGLKPWKPGDPRQ